MNVFTTHRRIVRDYASYIGSFLNIADPAIREAVRRELEGGRLWPEPLLQFNPAFERQGSLEALTAEIGIPGLSGSEGRTSILDLIDEQQPGLPLAPQVRAGLALSPHRFAELKALFRRVLNDFEPDLRARAGGWYGDRWIERNLGRIADPLDDALARWRRLCRSAGQLLSRASQAIQSGLHSLGSEEYRRYKRNQDQATRQLDLLRPDPNGDLRGSTELTEFYPYRYLAAEGFFPGYNFTRLPLRLFLRTADNSGEFISRPRAIALRDSGR